MPVVERGLKIAARAAVAALCLLASAPAALAAPREPLGHAGRWITDADGRVVILHGAAVVPHGFSEPIETAEGAGFTREDAAFLAGHGFNVVRLGMFYAGYEREPNVFDEAYADSAARTQRLLADAGVFTVLDFHQDMLSPRYQGRGFPEWFPDDDGLPNQPQAGFPGNYFLNPALNRAYDNLWANAPAPDGTGLQDHFAAGWRRIAARFESAPLVAGYDILNEPWPGTEWPSCANTEGCPPGGFDQTKLTPFHDRVIAAIRTVDDRHLAFYEPNLQFDVGARTGHGKAADPNVGMSFHNYCLGAAPGLPHVPDPAGACRDQGERRVFQNAEDHSAATGATLLMTEFGDVEDAAIHARVADLADEFMVGWTVWAWFRSTGQIKRDPARPPTPDNLRLETLAAVVRPFPRIVAGTPTRYGFDRDAKRFELRFATRLPGGAPAGGMESEVFVPALHFGPSYRVRLEGAELVGGLGTQLLRLRACPGAASVSMTVTDEAPAEVLTCPERGTGVTGRRTRCPRGNSRTVRCARTTLPDGTRAMQIVGTRRDERLVGTHRVDVIVCGAGDDRARAGRGADVVRCGSGDDSVGSGAGRDRVYGGPGRDRLTGGPNGDRLKGGTGRDRHSGGSGSDRILSRDRAPDSVRCGTGRDRTVADRADSIVRDCERRL